MRLYIKNTVTKPVIPVPEPAFLVAREPWEKWVGLPKSSNAIVMAINLLKFISIVHLTYTRTCIVDAKHNLNLIIDFQRTNK